MFTTKINKSTEGLAANAQCRTGKKRKTGAPTHGANKLWFFILAGFKKNADLLVHTGR